MAKKKTTKNNAVDRDEQRVGFRDIEKQIRDLLFLSGNGRKLLEKLIFEHKVKKPISDIVKTLFKNGNEDDVIRANNVVNLVKVAFTKQYSHVNYTAFSLAMKEAGFLKIEQSGVFFYTHIKLRKPNVSKKSRFKAVRRVK